MDEAIALANDSEYSLSAGIWTSDLQEAMSYAPQIRAASVQVNGATVFTETSVGHVSSECLPEMSLLMTLSYP